MAVRITLLSRSPKIPSTHRLVEVARERGHQTRVLDPTRVEMLLSGGKAGLFYQRRKLSPTDVVIPRIAQSVSHYGLAVVNQLGVEGTPLLNNAVAIAQSRNKMRCLQLLSAHGVDIPVTAMARNAADMRELVSRVGGVPVLVKLLQGTERGSVMICETQQSLKAALEAVLGLGQDLLVQQYVKRTGRDVRVFVVGGRVLTAVRRLTRAGRLTHSLLKGARLKAMSPTQAQQRAALRAAELVGLEVAAVDLLDVQGVPKVFEVHSSPAIVEMERATGVDLATPIIERAEALAATPSAAARR